MNVKRLEKLAAHLDKVPRRAFKMDSWVIGKDGTTECERGAVTRIRQAAKNDFKCGMAACVGGHAAILFPDLLTIREGSLAYLGERQVWDVEAFARAFKICREHALYLTTPIAMHQTPKAAAQVIRELIEEDPPCCRTKAVTH